MPKVASGEPISFAQAFDLIHSPLATVEERLRDQARSFDPAVEGYVAYVCGSGGKRLRPALSLLSAGATGKITGAHVDLAVILELIHIATLVHDDIMDGAELRRDQPTANAKWGNAITVLLGDCLFAHALRLSTHFSNSEISRRIADAAAEVCSGEIIQTQRRFDLKLSTGDYFHIIEMKTAALFSVACELGAALNEADRSVIGALKTFGTKLGVAYQIYDDILDLTGSEEETGKTLGTDLRKGKFTLPVLLMLQSGNDLSSLRDAAQALREATTVALRLLDEADEHLNAVRNNNHACGLGAIGEHLRTLLKRF